MHVRAAQLAVAGIRVAHLTAAAVSLSQSPRAMPTVRAKIGPVRAAQLAFAAVSLSDSPRAMPIVRLKIRPVRGPAHLA